MFKNILIISVFFFLCSCNVITKEFGGSMTVEIDKNEKLVNCSWKKDGSLWMLTRARKDGEQPETFKYTEKSNFRILEGTVIIVEK